MTDYKFDGIILKHNFGDWLLIEEDGTEHNISFEELEEDCSFIEAKEFCKNYVKNLGG